MSGSIFQIHGPISGMLLTAAAVRVCEIKGPLKAHCKALHNDDRNFIVRQLSSDIY